MSGALPEDHKLKPNQKKSLKCKFGFHTFPRGIGICKFCGASWVRRDWTTQPS